jgi:hypothetical protein
MAKGNAKVVKLTSLKDAHQKLYRDYLTEQKRANDKGKALAKAIKAEWDRTYPDGKDGKYATFSGTFGKLYVEWKTSKRGATGGTFDEGEGEDVF